MVDNVTLEVDQVLDVLLAGRVQWPDLTRDAERELAGLDEVFIVDELVPGANNDAKSVDV